MMRVVLTACHRMLAPDGSLYLHIDYRMSPYLRLMLDEIFGQANFMNEIIWAYKSGGRSTRHFSRKHDTILFYRKSKAVYFNIHAVGVPRGPEKRNNMKRSIDELGRVYFPSAPAVRTIPITKIPPSFQATFGMMSSICINATQSVPALAHKSQKRFCAASSLLLHGRVTLCATCFPAAAPQLRLLQSLGGAFSLQMPLPLQCSSCVPGSSWVKASPRF